MKVNRQAQVKGKSQKWKDVRGKRCRPSTITSSDLNSSPVMAMVIKEHQTAVKRKHSVKRLKKKAKSISISRKNNSQSGFKKSHSQANGSSMPAMDGDSNDSQGWKEYSQSILRNSEEPSGELEDARPGRLEGEALHYCAERDDRQNHAVLVMQKNQVGFGGNLATLLFYVTQSSSVTEFNVTLLCRRCVSAGSAS